MKATLFCLLFLGNMLVWSQRLSMEQLKELEKTADSPSEPDSIRMTALYRLAYNMRMIDASKAGEYLQRYYELVKEKGNTKRLALYYKLVGESAMLEGLYDKARLSFEDSAKLFKSVNDTLLYLYCIDKILRMDNGQAEYKKVFNRSSLVLDEMSNYPLNNRKAHLYVNRANSLYAQRQYKKAIADFKLALQGYRADQYAYGEYVVYTEMTLMYMDMNDLEAALDYAMKSVQHPVFQSIVPHDKVSGYVNLGFVYYRKRNFKKALQIFKTAEQYNPGTDSYLASTLSIYKAMVRYQLGETDTVIQLLNDAIKGLSDTKYYLYRDYHYTLALCYMRKKQYVLAEQNFKKALQRAEKSRNDIFNLELKANSKKMLSVLQLQKQDIEAAFKLLEESNQIELEKVKFSKNVELNKEVKSFDLKEKRTEIKKLTAEQLRTKLELKEQQNKLILLFAGLGLLAVVFVFTYRSYILKKKSAIQLEEKKNIIENQNRDLEEALAEKGILLKEIHHRVKNNFQMVISLLQLQANEGNRENVDAFLEEATTRILSMSLIHQKLYESENLSAVDFKDYVQELADSVYRAFSYNEEQLQFSINIPKITFDIQTAIPLGLILNEMMINTVKYVHGTVPFTQIYIGLTPINEDLFELVYYDNGIKVVSEKETSFGTELITLLVQQLGGTLQTKNSPNVYYSITFKNSE